MKLSVRDDDPPTPFELQLLHLFGRGLSIREIAETTAMSEAHAKLRVSTILVKLGIRDRREALACAKQRYGEDLQAHGFVTLHTSSREDLKGLRHHGLPSRVEVHSSSLLSFDGLADVDHVIAIDASNCSRLESIEGVRGRTDLVSLRLSSCTSLQNIDAVATLVNLESLMLTDCTNIRDIHPITNLEKLRELMVWGNENVPKDLWRFYKSREEVEQLQITLRRR